MLNRREFVKLLAASGLVVTTGSFAAKPKPLPYNLTINEILPGSAVGVYEICPKTKKTINTIFEATSVKDSFCKLGFPELKRKIPVLIRVRKPGIYPFEMEVTLKNQDIKVTVINLEDRFLNMHLDIEQLKAEQTLYKEYKEWYEKTYLFHKEI